MLCPDRATISASCNANKHNTSDDNLYQFWADAIHDFLSSCKSDNTRRMYQLAVVELMGVCQKRPEDVTTADVEHYVRWLQDKQLSAGTINQRLSAISAFYKHLQFNSSANNVLAIKNLRCKPSAASESIAMSAEEIEAFLCAIPRHTITGKRDYALMVFYILSGRRTVDIQGIRWGDISQHNDTFYYRWVSGNTEHVSVLPDPVWRAILDYLTVSDRLSKMVSASPIFVAHNANAARLPNVAHRDNPWLPGHVPLSARMINILVKRYAKAAGLSDGEIRPRTLRNSCAYLVQLAGGNITEVSQILDHANIYTTKRCLERIGRGRKKLWTTVAKLIGV